MEGTHNLSCSGTKAMSGLEVLLSDRHAMCYSYSKDHAMCCSYTKDAIINMKENQIGLSGFICGTLQSQIQFTSTRSYFKNWASC